MEDLQKRSLLARNLIKLRKKHGLTQEELSRISGVSRRTIALYETRPANPPLQNIEKLAKAFNIKIEELVNFEQVSKKLEVNFSDIDLRTLKRIKQILALSPEERHMVYAFVDSLLMKKKQRKAK